MSMDLCNLDLLICFTEYLNVNDILTLSSCNRKLYLLLGVESIWKRLCRIDFGLTYNHPKQLYRTLYQNTFQQKYGRLPCQHISTMQINFDLLLYEFPKLNLNDHTKPNNESPMNDHHNYDDDDDNDNNSNNDIFGDFTSCSKCYEHRIENIFICMHPDCYKICNILNEKKKRSLIPSILKPSSLLVCDSHSRIHARLNHDCQHSLFFKPNTCEIFCMKCLEWLGNTDSDPAEQYKTKMIMKEWEQQQQMHNNNNSSLQKNHLKMKILTLRTKRRYERFLRWKDTPQYILKNTKGYCFISARWMKEWEQFIEGTVTYPPTHLLDNDQWRLSDGTLQLSLRFNPFSSTSSDLMIISTQIWDYLTKNYTVKGNQITENDLKSHPMYDQLNHWKSRII
ncbi:unnamed protein product [Cunninghamella blakesleeana]